MIKRTDLKLRTTVILGLVIFSIFYILPLKEKINFGLDLKGGMYVLLRADTASIPSYKVPDAVSAAVEKIRNRIDAYGVKETSIQVQGKESILVQVPGVVNREMIDKLKEVGKLEFNLVNDNKERLALAINGDVPAEYTLKRYKDSYLLLHKDPDLIGSDLSESFMGFNSYGGAEVSLRFTSLGAKKFAKVTEENVGKRLAIVLDGKVMSAPQIREPILSGQAQITGRDEVCASLPRVITLLPS